MSDIEMIDFTPKRQRSLSQKLKFVQEDQNHYRQCDCDVIRTKFWKKEYKKLIVQHDSCSKAQKWLEHCRIPNNKVAYYQQLLNSPVEESVIRPSLTQLQLDLSRTYPESKYFTADQPGNKALKQVLTAYCKYNPNLGYVQGMNYIAGTMLWHSQEHDAFWLFVSLMEDFELMENYLPMLPGLNRHSRLAETLLQRYLPNLREWLVSRSIVSEMIVTDWVLTMFGSLTFIKDNSYFYDFFFNQGWFFFHKVVLEILGRLENSILQCQDTNQLQQIIKPMNKSPARLAQYLQSLQKPGEKLTFKKLLKSADQFDLDLEFVSQTFVELSEICFM